MWFFAWLSIFRKKNFSIIFGGEQIKTEMSQTGWLQSYNWLQFLCKQSEQHGQSTLHCYFFMLFTDPLCILLDCRWSMDCISLDKIALTWMYLLSDASIAFTTLADGCSPIAWRNIVKSELLLTVTQWVGFSCVSIRNISGRGVHLFPEHWQIWTRDDSEILSKKANACKFLYNSQ